MKQLLPLLIVLLPLVVLAQPKGLRLASDVWPPFTNVESRQRVALELVNEALRRDDIVAVTEITDFKSVLDGITSGQYNGSAALWKNGEREKDFFFSEAYLENRLVLVGRKGADVSSSSFKQLAGKRIAIVHGYAYGDEVDEAEGPVFVDGESDQQNLRKLLVEEVDYMLVDALLVQYLKIHHLQEIGQYLEVGAIPFLRHTLHFALRKDVAGAESIISNFNQRIHEMAADGSYNQILHINWIEVDADGDGTMEYVLSGTNAGTRAPVSSYSVFANSGGGENDQYLINGQVYKGWDTVPGEFKVAPTSDESLNKLRIFDFAVPNTPRK
ncbi:MAG: ABC transporter substrate-binding protein [Bacteroidota bacterium]